MHSSEGEVYQDINTKIKKGKGKRVIITKKNKKKQNHIIGCFGHVTPAKIFFSDGNIIQWDTRHYIYIFVLSIA